MVCSCSLLQALMLPVMAMAQSYTSCNPLKVSDCPADKALASSFREDFKSESKYFSPTTPNDDRITYSDQGVAISLKKRFDNPSLKSNFYIMFGRLEVIFKAAPGRGIVSSFYLQSDDLDEIDLEWIGSDTTEVQTNYFSKGDTTTYDRGGFHGVYEPQQNYHNYTIDWTKDSLVWYLDGAPIRTLNSDSPSGYPQSPMFIVMGIWAGGDPSNQPGTIEWAGGLVDYSQAPFTMNVQSVIVSDYSTGSEYKYGDQSGQWTSIEAVGGEVNGRLNQAQQEFAALADGGDVENNFQPSEGSSQTFDISAASSTVPAIKSSTSQSSSSSSSSSSSDSSTSESTERSSSWPPSSSFSSSVSSSLPSSQGESSSSEASKSTSKDEPSSFSQKSSSSDPGVTSSFNKVSSTYTSSTSALLSSSSASSRAVPVFVTSSTNESSINSSAPSSSANGSSSKNSASPSATLGVKEANSGQSLVSSIGVKWSKSLMALIFLTSFLLLV